MTPDTQSMTRRGADDLSLSKGQILAGLRCHKKLWLEFHERDAPELRPDGETLVRFTEGRIVGEHARRAVDMHGTGVNLAPGHDIAQHAVVARTTDAIARGALLLFEAGFVAGGGSVRTDIMQRAADSPWQMIEVKSTKWSPKDRDREAKLDVHVPDVAVQAWVAREASVVLDNTHLMYLNPDCRHPNLTNLFTTVDVTARVESFSAKLPGAVAAMREVIEGAVPNTPVGTQCTDPDKCPFYERCHPKLPDHHVSELYYAKRKDKDALIAAGKLMIHDLAENDAPNPAAKRQVRAVQAGKRIVEPGLLEALAALTSPIVHLDFETVQLAVPRWPGCAPQDMVAVQFSAHRERLDGGTDHVEYLADRGGDPRPALIDALVSACEGAGTVLVYFEPFEKKRLEELAAWFPARAGELMAIHSKIVDLLPIVRNHVYDPAFRGSFSLKKVLPALVPDLSHANLAIPNGAAATAAIYRMLFESGLDPAEARAMRADLLEYCHRDTEAMVRLLQVLWNLAT